MIGNSILLMTNVCMSTAILTLNLTLIALNLHRQAMSRRYGRPPEPLPMTFFVWAMSVPTVILFLSASLTIVPGIVGFVTSVADAIGPR